jgi:epoxyqueuosine reductase
MRARPGRSIVDDMQHLSQIALEFPLSHGAFASGIATLETLRGGPPSTDLSFVLSGARSAVSFALPFDRTAIDPYLMKRDRLGLERSYNHAEITATGLGVHFANYLTKRGFPSVYVAAGQVYREDIQSRASEAEQKIAEEFKEKEYVHKEGSTMVPDIALRYLAIASGVGSMGISGNVLTRQEGAAIALGGIITTAELVPTAPIPEEESYCDDCRLCMASCISGLMDPDGEISIRMGGVEHKHAGKRSIARCQMACGGITGLHPSGKWSTWSPGRFIIPKTDEELSQLGHAMGAFFKRPNMEGGVHHHVLIGKKYYMSCSHCQLVCVPDKEERKRRYKLLKRGGCIVQNPEDGSVKALPPDEAREYVASMSPEIRVMYEDVEEG